MGIRQRVKNLMDDLPFGADIYWQLRGKRKPWSAHYELEGLKAVLCYPLFCRRDSAV